MKKKITNYSKIFNFSEQKVVILGGLGLIGYETTKAFLEFGADVLIVDVVNKKSKIKSLTDVYGNKLKYLNQSQLSDKKIFSLTKKYSTLINCVYSKNKEWNELNFEKINKRNFEKNLKNINLTSLWYPIFFADSLKKHNKPGSIINIGSIYGLVAQDENIYINTKISENIVYNYNKSGLINFTKALASKYSKHGIRSNIVCPGGVRDRNNSLQNRSFLKNYSKRVPIGRLAETSEIASVILFLSTKSSSYITGTAIIVDGGWLSI